MHLWLLCCALLFALTQGYQWLFQHTEFPIANLPLPWAILGGIGLAIASNRSLSQPSRNPSARQVMSTQNQSPTSEPEQPVPAIEPAAPPASLTAQPQQSSISFEISPKS